MVAPISRADAVRMMLNRTHQAGSGSEDFTGELYRRIGDGKAIPVISESFRLEHIFRSPIRPADGTHPASRENVQPIENWLAQGWAEEIHYPMMDSDDLARVAQYLQAMETVEKAKDSYLVFLKKTLLLHAGYNPQAAEARLQQPGTVGKPSLTGLARDLGYPRFIDMPDPLETLARLPLTIYVTTSVHDFIEEALVQAGKEPVTQACFWSGIPDTLDAKDEILKDYIPSVEKPLVYHLYGLDRYPASLVLSDDDYMEYLYKVTHDMDPEHPVLPMYLRSALSTYSLLLFGYRPASWDFRVLFRSVLNAPGRTNWINLIVQPPPEQEYPPDKAGEARLYLDTYFKPTHFKVECNGPELFLSQVWEARDSWKVEQ
jgi:hypothetical protein